MRSDLHPRRMGVTPPSLVVISKWDARHQSSTGVFLWSATYSKWLSSKKHWQDRLQIWSGFHQSSRGVCFTMGVKQPSSMLLHRSVFHHSSMDLKSSSIAELLKWSRCMSLEWYGCAGVHSRRDVHYGSIPRDYRQVSNISALDPKLRCFSSRLAVAFVQYMKARH